MGYTGMCCSTGYGFCLSESGTGPTNQRFCLEQGKYCFFPFRLWNTLRVTCLPSELRCKRTLLLFLLGSHCMLTPTHSFRFEGQLCLTIFSVWNRRIYFHHFVWNRVAKLCLFSLEQDQVPRHSAAHPHPKLRWVPPPQGFHTPESEVL